MQVYLDDSSTSWPKPVTVIEAVGNYLNNYGVSPGRSGHKLSLLAAREVFETRELIAGLFNLPDSEKVIFATNATHAINIALKGFLKKGDHVIISSMEHNSVYRPLWFMKEQGLIDFTVVGSDDKGKIKTDELKNSFRSNTRLVLVIHGSNVFGSVNPVDKIGEICMEKGVAFMVDAAQTAGFIPIDMQKDNISLLAFTGHKKLYGPSGIGGLCINGDIDIASTFQGGTGSRSEMEAHPDFYPDKLEAGTPNTFGIVGLKAGIQFILNKGMDNLRKQQTELTEYFIEQLREINELKLYLDNINEERLPQISLNLKNIISSDVAYKLDKEHDIMIRAGLHCSPQAHKSLKTFPHGTVRFSLGGFNTEEDIIYTIKSLKKIINKYN
jgi:cysteine desulfurase / selenocysteine lyase